MPSTVEAARLAEEEARKAITIDPDDPAAQRAVAAALLIGGNYSAALEHVDHALSLNRNSAAAYRVKASALVTLWGDARMVEPMRSPPSALILAIHLALWRWVCLRRLTIWKAITSSPLK